MKLLTFKRVSRERTNHWNTTQHSSLNTLISWKTLHWSVHRLAINMRHRVYIFAIFFLTHVFLWGIASNRGLQTFGVYWNVRAWPCAPLRLSLSAAFVQWLWGSLLSLTRPETVRRVLVIRIGQYESSSGAGGCS